MEWKRKTTECLPTALTDEHPTILWMDRATKKGFQIRSNHQDTSRAAGQQLILSSSHYVLACSR
ncbi:hypothetical protein BDA96_04G008800 [Sorghum bicolor]|uniref:Uncharacterized protein n=2 Tax=Sorghum bicolor TaxID=4558 RepID=A0A921UGV0_SORBI|nr:hypothetical protein BDA96_04G008800 [Sorghum bicolor]OQU84189.1 hypothetical protein SORBI_3004G007850 [Sorghum bicolor]